MVGLAFSLILDILPFSMLLGVIIQMRNLYETHLIVCFFIFWGLAWSLLQEGEIVMAHFHPIELVCAMNVVLDVVSNLNWM